MAAEVGNGQVAIFPVFKGFRRAVTREITGAEQEGSARFRRGFARYAADAGREAGKGFSKSFESTTADLGKTLQAEVAKTAGAVSASRLKEQDAAGRVRIAEAQLAEARSKYAADSSQVVRAEERLATAHRTLSVAQSVTQKATENLTSAQARLAEALAQSETAARRSGFAAFRTNITNLLAPVSALTRGIAGLASRALTPMVRSLVGFGRSVGSTVATALRPAAIAVRDFGLQVGLRVTTALSRAEKTLTRVFAPALERLRPVTSAIARSFQGAFGLVRQAVSTVAPALAGLGGIASSVGSGIASAFRGAMSVVRDVSADAAQVVGSVFKVAGAAIATALGAAFVGGFMRLSNIETAEARMRGLGLSAEDVAASMDIAKKAAEGTSFSLDQMAGAAAAAAQAGLRGDAMVAYLEAVKGAATASGRELGDVAVIFGNVRGAQKAYTGDINQLAAMQIPIWDALADTIGVTNDEVRKLATDGKISAEQFEAAVRSATGGLAAEVGNTTAASARNARTALSKLGAVLLGGAFPAFKTVFDTIKSGLQAVTRLVEPIATQIVASLT